MHATVIDWDGTRLPDELRGLPPGRYLVAPLDDHAELTVEEDAAVRLGLDELAAGEVVPLVEVIQEIHRPTNRSPDSLGEQAERGAVARAHRPEVALVEGDHQVGSESLGQGNDRRIGPADREIGVLLDEVGDPRPVSGGWRVHVEVTKAAQERSLGTRPKTTAEQVRRLRDNEGRDHEVQIGPFEDIRRPLVLRLRSVRGGDKWSRVNDGQQDPSLLR